MTSSTSTIDYRNTIFQYPTLTKIHGEPTAEAILKLIKELKANARSVYSDLVGGRHGHLFLVLTPEQFASISSTPFVRPEHPGSLNLPPHATQAVIRELKDIRNDKLRLFKEVNAVEATLIQQINTAIDGDYLQAIRNRISNTLEGPVYNIIKHLLTNYGKITAQMLANKEDELRQLTYDPNLPMDFLFSKIDDLSEFANQAGTPYTDIQRMQKAYLLIQRTARFNQHITEWNRLPPEQRNTWDLFKKFFRKAHQEYREVTNLTLRDFGENHSAYLVQEVVNAVTERVSESLESANAIRDTIPQMMHEIQQLKTQMQQIKLAYVPPPQPYFLPPHPQFPPSQSPFPSTNQNVSTNQSSNTNSEKQNNVPNTNQGRRGKKFRKFYCWTHGLTNHSSDRCLTPAEGHQPQATLYNRMGGNTRNCPANSNE